LKSIGTFCGELFGLWIRVGPRNHVLYGGPDHSCKTVNGNVERRRPIVKYIGTFCGELFERWTPVSPRKHV